MFNFRKRIEEQGSTHVAVGDGPRHSSPPSARDAAAAAPGSAASAQDLETLAKQSRRLNLVHRELLLRAIDEAVRRGVSAHVPGLDRKALAKVSFSARNELVRLLRESSRSVRGVPKAAFLREVEADRQRILAERAIVQGEIDKMQARLQERREEVGRIEVALVQESRQSGILQDEVLTQRIFELFGGTEASHELASIREQVTYLLLKTLNDEREKVLEAQLAEHRREVENFERRISKLTQSLELTEEELQRIAKAKGIDPGVASIYRTVQGLDGEDDWYEAKLEMMASIFEANLALQKRMEAGE